MQAFRTAIFWAHLCCGLGAGLVVFVMSATGVLLTYEKQLAAWADGYQIAQPAEASPRPAASVLMTAAQQRWGKDPTGLQLNADTTEPARIYFGRRESHPINPYTGEPLGEGATGVRGFFRTMIAWHRWLGQEGDGRALGKAITGACNLAFLFIIVSGAYLWWPKKWAWPNLRAVVLFRRGLRGKARDFNWHNVIGLWMAVPLFLVVGTATFFSYSWPTDALWALTGEVRPQGGSAQATRKEKPRGPASYSDLDELFRIVTESEPGWRTVTLRLSSDPSAPAEFAVDRGNGFRPDLRSSLWLDRATATLVRHTTYSDNASAQNIRFWIRFIHTGESGGILGQTLAGLASLAGCLLMYTGWMLTWRRFQAWRVRRRAPTAASES